MSLLPTYNVSDVFTSEEIDIVDQWIQKNGKLCIDDGRYDDSGYMGRHGGKLIAKNIMWDYHHCPEVGNILTPKLENLLQKKLIVPNAHILEARIPYLIHSDILHENQGHVPEYTMLIPLDTYDSITVCFNEWSDTSNDFEIFKQNYTGEKRLRMDPRFCANRLSHLHPKDLAYLTLHDTFAWNKGSVFAMDRRYFHCSDNFLKKGLSQKRAIVLWTAS